MSIAILPHPFFVISRSFLDSLKITFHVFFQNTVEEIVFWWVCVYMNIFIILTIWIVETGEKSTLIEVGDITVLSNLKSCKTSSALPTSVGQTGSGMIHRLNCASRDTFCILNSLLMSSLIYTRSRILTTSR